MTTTHHPRTFLVFLYLLICFHALSLYGSFARAQSVDITNPVALAKAIKRKNADLDDIVRRVFALKDIELVKMLINDTNCFEYIGRNYRDSDVEFNDRAALLVARAKWPKKVILLYSSYCIPYKLYIESRFNTFFSENELLYIEDYNYRQWLSDRYESHINSTHDVIPSSNSVVSNSSKNPPRIFFIKSKPLSFFIMPNDKSIEIPYFLILVLIVSAFLIHKKSKARPN